MDAKIFVDLWLLKITCYAEQTSNGKFCSRFKILAIMRLLLCIVPFSVIINLVKEDYCILNKNSC